MQRYTHEQIDQFLLAIDRHLSESAQLIIIGGAAAAMAYRFKGATQDIDTANSISALTHAILNARQETGFQIPVNQTGVFDAPYEYEDRLITYTKIRCKNLVIRIPDPMDLILMKTVRLEEHDLKAIETVIRETGTDPNALVRRYIDEMNHVIKKTT